MQAHLAMQAAHGTLIVIDQLAFHVVVDDQNRYTVKIRVIAPGTSKSPVISYDEQTITKREADRRVKRRALVTRADKRRRQSRASEGEVGGAP
jgi:hypothetical protein